MKDKDFESRYSELIATHKASITFELQKAYDKEYSRFHVNWGGYIYLPIFVLLVFSLMLLPRPVSTLKIIFITLTYILIAFVQHRCLSAFLHKIFSYYFEEYKQKDILLPYIHRCKNGTIRNTESQDQVNEIEQFFQYVENRIVTEHFRFR